MDNLAHVAMLLVRLAPGLPIAQVVSGRPEVLGHATAELSGQPLAALCVPQAGEAVADASLQARVGALQPGCSERMLWSLRRSDGSVSPHEVLISRTAALPEFVTVCIVDLGALAFAKALSDGENELLQMVATGQALKPVLERLTTLIEAQFLGLYCSVMLLGTDGCTSTPAPGPACQRAICSCSTA